MPGPNNGKSGRVVKGNPRPRGEQPTEREKAEAVHRYNTRNNKQKEVDV